MSQSTGLTQRLFCLAASTGFRLVFVQYLTPLLALGLKPTSAAAKATSLLGKELSCPSALLGSDTLFYSMYFSQVDEA